MAHRLKVSETQMDTYRKYESELEHKKILRTGCNNAVSAIDHMTFDDEDTADYILSYCMMQNSAH